MPRLSLAAVLFCAIGLLSACQLSGDKAQTGPDEGVTANAVAGGAIEVTALDAPPAEAEAPKAAGTEPAGRDTAAPQAAPAADGAASEADGQQDAARKPAPKPDLDEVPVTPKSERQLACEKKGSKWFKIGDGEKYGCVKETRDAGKRCQKESQCDGVCLARSGTCSPFKPLYGCNEILQDNGARVTLCLE
ncbi:MAG: hypothetical protein V4753_16555 [Pseudomonadota bacterium]